MANHTFPVQIITYQYTENGMILYYPQIIYEDGNIQKKINEEIEKTVFNLVKEQKERQDVQEFDEMIGLYEIKTNERNTLSITLSNYAIHAHFAHGLTIMSSLNFDLLTGKNVPFGDLFIPDSHYKEKLEHIIKLQIIERDIPTLNSVTVSQNQDYYIADKALVIFYQLYDITPYYVGLPMFPISVFAIENYMREDTILSRMLY